MTPKNSPQTQSDKKIKPTPETDSAFGDSHIVTAEFARDLERRLTECREALKAIAYNPGDCDMETGFTSGHIARTTLTATAPKP